MYIGILHLTRKDSIFMIKETDASKNDERRVQNKLNPLTHKRKGETRTMYNQSTKHWKLGAFFVISLMLIAGLFSNTASAQSAKITVSPTSMVSRARWCMVRFMPVTLLT